MTNQSMAKELKFAIFRWDDEQKEFHILTKDGEGSVVGTIRFNKIYAFAIVRFLLRVFQRNFSIRRARVKRG